MPYRSHASRAVVAACSAGLAAVLTGGLLMGLGSTNEQFAVAATAAESSNEPSPVPSTEQSIGTVPATSLVAAEVRARTPEQARADRERSIRASRMARVAKLRTRIVDVARKQIGDRYVPGRAGPDAFDCSGLTRYVYKVAMGKELPHGSRAQYTKVKRIKKSQAQPGDLVFFFENGEHHVGIYIGRGKMIDAPGVGDPVRVSPISGDWWGRSYTGMGRILPG
jgi:cell wall-associated NlpC family hydrolase